MTDAPKRIFARTVTRKWPGDFGPWNVEPRDGDRSHAKSYLREDIARAVRPLEWRTADRQPGSTATATFGCSYWVSRAQDGLWAWRLYNQEDLPADGQYNFKSEIDARAAAQADFDQEVFSALMPVEGE